MTSAEELEAAGLYDPVADAGSGRLELLLWLLENDVTMADMQRAVSMSDLGPAAAADLAALAADRRLLGGPLSTRAETIERSGVPGDELDALTVALGLIPVVGAPAGEVGLTADEAAAIGAMGELVTLFSPEESMAFVRVIGSTIGRIADAAVSAFLRDIESPHIAAGGSPLDLAKQGYAGVIALESFADIVGPLLRRHVLQAIERARMSTISAEERFRYRYAVGFVDLVGFTTVSGAMSPQELAAFLRDFEGQTHDVVTRAGARVVKLIGDEVMFVSTDAASACRAANALMSGFTAAMDHVVPRGGLSYGDVLVRGGDYYGTIVNLAARLVDQAVPQELLVTAELAEAAQGCTFEPAGRRSLKGFDEPVAVSSFVSG